MPEQSRGWDAVRVERDGGRSDEPGELPVEAPLIIEVNGVHLGTLMRLPGNDRELVLGWLLTEGLAVDPGEISSLECAPDDPNLLRVGLTGEIPPISRAGFQPADIVPQDARGLDPGAPTSSQAGVGVPTRSEASRSGLPDPVPLEGPPISAELLMRLRGVLEQHQPIRERAGGVHAAAIFTREGELVAACEDVGRHNALDKVIGHCVLAGDTLADKIVVTTGRLRAEMVVKLARARIGLACSMTAPSSLGVELADRLGITLVGRLGRDRFQVFTHPQRVG